MVYASHLLSHRFSSFKFFLVNQGAIDYERDQADGTLLMFDLICGTFQKLAWI